MWFTFFLPGSPSVADRHPGCLLPPQTGSWLAAHRLAPVPIAQSPFDVSSVTPMLCDGPSCKTHKDDVYTML